MQTEFEAAKELKERELVLRILSAATFLIFFQAYMVAPLIPKLSKTFSVSPQTLAIMIPAYLVPYGICTLFYGPLSASIGRSKIMIASLTAFVALTGMTATAHSPAQLVFWRIATGMGASGVVPLALMMIGQTYPFEKRGRPLGWLFGAMAGGMAFGSTCGALAEPMIGWRGLFFFTAFLGLCILLSLIPRRKLLGNVSTGQSLKIVAVLSEYRKLLSNSQSFRTYGYVFANAIFHSGIYTWLGYYFSQQYSLGEAGIGVALLGYGVPGFLFGPAVGKLADRYGRGKLIPIGISLAALSAIALGFPLPMLVAGILVTTLSLGYDMTQPLLAGIVTKLGGQSGGQAMALNVFLLFLGSGLGSLIFGYALVGGLPFALKAFGVTFIALAGLSVFIFKKD